MKYLVFDVGGTAIKYSLMTKDLDFLEKGKVKTPRTCLEDFVETIGGIYDKYKDEIEGMAFSLPGMLDSKTGYAHTAGSLEYYSNKNIVEILGERCKTKITIENDGKCAALAELWQGNLKDCTDGVVILFVTGVGGGIIKDRKLLKGRNFFSGEFSFMTANATLMSNKYENNWGHLNGSDGLLDEFAKVKNLNRDEVDGITFFWNANNGDKDALEILDKFAGIAAHSIINIHCILDVDKYLIGGGISEQPILLEYIQKNIDRFHDELEYDFPKPVIGTCKFRNDSNLIGALYNFLDTNKIININLEDK